jgi:hypothetical protein
MIIRRSAQCGMIADLALTVGLVGSVIVDRSPVEVVVQRRGFEGATVSGLQDAAYVRSPRDPAPRLMWRIYLGGRRGQIRRKVDAPREREVETPMTKRARAGIGAPGLSVVIAAVLALGAVGSSAARDGVAADARLQQRLGLKTEALTPERRKSQIDAFAKVLDPGPLAQLDSDLMTAVAAAAASRAEADRAKALNASGGSISGKDLEADEAQAKSDAIKVALLRHRLGLEWGSGIARLSDGGRESLIKALASGAAAIVHVDTPSNAGQAGAKTVKIDVGSDSIQGVVLGPARAAEPRLQSSGLIVEVTGPSAVLLSVGLIQSAHIDTGDPQPGVILKRGALIRYQGSTWAYVRHAGNRFERRLVEDGVPEEAGLFVAKGFAPGDNVVVEGAGGLFAAELSSAPGQVK